MNLSLVNTTNDRSVAAWNSWEASRNTYVPLITPIPRSLFVKIWNLCEEDSNLGEPISLHSSAEVCEKSKCLIEKLNTLSPEFKNYNPRSISTCFKTILLQRTPNHPLAPTQAPELNPKKEECSPIGFFLKEMSLEYPHLKPLTPEEVASIWLECETSILFWRMGPANKPKNPNSYIYNKVSSLLLKRAQSGLRADTAVKACIKKIVSLLIENPPGNEVKNHSSPEAPFLPNQGQPPLKKVKESTITEEDWSDLALALQDDDAIMDNELRDILLELDDPK